jgi:hypothetical protein
MANSKPTTSKDILANLFTSSVPKNPLVLVDPTQPQRVAGQNHGDDDYDFARKQLREIIEIGMGALAEAAAESSRTGSSNSFVATAQTLKAVTDANEKLLNLSVTHKELNEQKNEDSGGPQTVNNNLFVGSTDEMLEMIKAKKNDKQISE